MRTFTMAGLTLPGGMPLTVEYEWTPGTPDSYMEQGDPPEVNITAAWHDEYGDAVLTDADHEHLLTQIFEKHDPMSDYDDYDDFV